MGVAVVTYAGLPQLDSYDAPLLPTLAALGLDARPILWDDPAMDSPGSITRPGRFARAIARTL